MIRGTSVTRGYFQRPDLNRDLYDASGWLATGDTGYFCERDLVVCGRIKSQVVIGGRNISAEDIERAAWAVGGVRPGNVVGLGISDGAREQIVVIAEIADGTGDIRRQISEAVKRAVGVTAADVVLIRSGSISKTSSGKLQRHLCRERYDNGELDALYRS